MKPQQLPTVSLAEACVANLMRQARVKERFVFWERFQDLSLSILQKILKSHDFKDEHNLVI